MQHKLGQASSGLHRFHFLTQHRIGNPYGGIALCYGHARSYRSLTGWWLQGIKGVPALEEGLNPATWMLQVSTPGMESTIGVDFGQIYRDSPLYE